MTDAADVAKHNNVGIGVALGGYLGALGKLGEGLDLAAREYQTAAAAVRAASEQKAAFDASVINAAEHPAHRNTGRWRNGREWPKQGDASASVNRA